MSRADHSISQKKWISFFPLAIGLGLVVYLYGFMAYLTGRGPERSIFGTMGLQIATYEEWQYCGLVPVAIVILLWLKRNELASLPVRGSLFGLIPGAIAFLLFYLSYRLDDVYVGYISIQLMAAALCLLFLGTAWIKPLFFPWLFLIFVFPLFFLDNLVAFPLRMVMSFFSVQALNAIGIATVRNGTAILSAPNDLLQIPAGKIFSVDVADPCSGIRSLFALMMVSALYGYFSLQGVWRRVALFACSIPLAIAGNFFRILAIIIGVILMGPDIAIGSLEKPSFFHMFAGYLIFVVALAGMSFIAWLLNGGVSNTISRLTRLPSSSHRKNVDPPHITSHPIISSEKDLY